MTAAGLQLLTLLHFKLQKKDTPEIRRTIRQTAMTFAGSMTPEQRNEAIANSLIAMSLSPAHSYVLDLVLIVAISKEMS
jgi:hypothetical protein